MRIINIDLSQDARCPQKVFGGNAREHNESKLIVKLPERILRDDISYYYFEFQTVLGEHIVSPNIYKNELSDGNKISVLLWEQLLPFAGDLNFCVNAVNLAEDNTITIKGKTSICVLQILKSPTGEDALINVDSTKEDLQKAIDDGVNEVVKKISIVGQKTLNGGEIFSTYEGENVNKALSEASSAFGQNNIAGCLGFKVSNFVKGGYDAQGNPYYAKVTLNTDATHFANIAVGDKVSVRINYNSTGLLVTAVNTSTKTVTLNDLLRSFPDFVASENDYLWCVEKPEAGDTPIGIGAFAGGFKGNQANQDGSLAIGRNNIADGRWSVALGTGNKAGYNTFVYGKNNKALRSETSIVLGSNNQQIGYMGDTFITGSNNTVGNIGYSNIIGLGNAISNAQRISVIGTGNDTNIDKFVADVTMIGNHLRPHENNQVILGSYNEVNENHRFAVGFGDSESTRKSTLNVFSDGSAEVYTQGNTNKSITQKQYVDINLENKLDKITTAGSTRLYSVNADGTQSIIDYGYGYNNKLKIAQYGQTGKLASELTQPLDDSNVLTTKSYVDDSIATQISSVYKAKGSVADISALPTPDKAHEGFVYNIESEFTTTDLFVEGAGKTYPAGTNVVIVNTTGTEYKYDVLAGMVDLSNYATKKYVDDAIGNITALFASLVDMTKTTQADEPVNDTEIVNEPTVDEGGLN